ncbi:DNA-directed DNA polymerase [Tanacetum coccineum]|uniref:DNA-directed DNA polymerase n=1 Tax=Tanacetum coccineum TaxID=301880 RepID=A0ABQ5F9X4_9ASTR
MANTVFYHLACTALLSSDCFLACLLCLELIIITIKPVPVSQAENPSLSLELDQLIRRIHQLDTTYRPFHSEQRNDLCSLNNVSILPNNTAYSVKSIRRTNLQQTHTAYSVKSIRRTNLQQTHTASYPTDLLSSENPERLFRLKKRIFETPGLVESSSPELDLFSDIEEHSEEETTEIMTETIGDSRSSNASSLSHILNWSRKSLAHERTIRFDYKLGNPENEVSKQEVILFSNGLDVPTRQILDSKDAIPTKTTADAKIAIQEMAEYSQKWHNETSSKARSTETSDRLAAIQAQLNNLGREMLDPTLGETTRGGKATTLDVRDNDTSVPPKEPVVVELEKPVRSNEDLTNDQPQITSKLVVQPSNKVQPPPVPFPKRLRKEKDEAQQKQFLENLKQLHINLPFIEALSQMPKYDKFLKGLLTNKARLEEACKIIMNEICSAVLLNKLPSKEKDLGSFTIPYNIGQLHIDNALADLGASISLMPYMMYKKLGLVEPKATRMSLELANRSIQYPRGIIENVLIKVDKFIIPIDFVILDMPEDSRVPIILGRPFLATARAMIDVFNKKITLRVGDDEVIFDVDQSIKRLTNEDDECYGIDDLDEMINKEA